MSLIRNHLSRKTAKALLGAVMLTGVGNLLAQDKPADAGPAPIKSVTTQPGVLPAEPASTRASDVVSNGLSDDGKLTLMVNKGQVVTTKLPYKTVNIANPEIADVNRVNDYEILLTAKKPGSTQLIVWDVAGLSQNVDIVVVSDMEALQGQLDKIFPGAGIQAMNVNGTIVLRGRVKNLEMAKQAEAIAAPYGQDVQNFLEIGGGQQVMLRVRFAEVSRSASSQLGFAGSFRDGVSQFGAINGPTATPIGALANGTEFVLNPAINLFGGGQIGGTAFEYFVQALRRNNLLRVLAEPNIIAISGEPASLLAGGEFPIPVPQSGGSDGNSITIEYKQFGVQLNFLPTVLGDGKIRLKVEPEVSDLDYSRSVSFQGFTIPGLTKRTLSTTIELNEGQTFAVAGLLNNRIVASKDTTPLLGDLPIIEALFRSVRYERSETELVVLVTPELVSPLNPDQVGDLPGEKFKDPTELQLFLDGKVGAMGGAQPKAVVQKGNAAHADATDATEATEATDADAINTEEPATEEEITAADTDAEPVRFRGQYGFVPATN